MIRRFIAAIFALLVFTSCSGYNPAGGATKGTTATNSNMTSTTTNDGISKLELGKIYQLPTVDIIFKALFKSKDRIGEDGLLMYYTIKYRPETPQQEMKDVQIDVVQRDLSIKPEPSPAGHEMINGKSPEMLPGGTLQNLVFFKTKTEQDLKIIVKSLTDETAVYSLTAPYPTESANSKDLKKLLLDDRLKLNEDYTNTYAPKEDLALVNETIQFTDAEFTLTDVKFWVNEIIYGRDLSIFYRYKPTLSANKTDLDIKIQAFQYGVEMTSQPIDKEPLDPGKEYQEADFIVNYKMPGAIIIRFSDPTVQRQLVFIPNDQMHSSVSR